MRHSTHMSSHVHCRLFLSIRVFSETTPCSTAAAVRISFFFSCHLTYYGIHYARRGCLRAMRSLRVQGSVELAVETEPTAFIPRHISLANERTNERASEATIALVLVKRQVGACKTRRRVAPAAPLKRVSLCLITHLAYAKQRQP